MSEDWQRKKREDELWFDQSEEIVYYAGFKDYGEIIREFCSELGLPKDNAEEINHELKRLAKRGRNPLMHNRRQEKADIEESKKIIKRIRKIINEKSNFSMS